MPAVGQSCAPALPHAAGRSDETITSGGLSREYILYVPESYDGTSRIPLVFNFHGFGSGDDQQLAYSGLAEKADDEGFIVLTPQGTGAPPFWNAFRLPSPDDVGFVEDLLDQMQASLCVDQARIYATGISNGGIMSARLACDLGDRIAAIATVAGILAPRNCASTRPVPVVAFHGVLDGVVPYEGGPVTAGGLVSVARPVQDVIADWAAYNRCAMTYNEDRLDGHVRHWSYSGCEATVEFYIVEDGGHTWPGARDVPRLGPTNHEINATDIIWDFFAAHAMSPAATP